MSTTTTTRPLQSMSTWSTGLPDTDTTVLLRLDDPENPIGIGFHDGETWRGECAGRITSPIVGWQHLDAAAVILDRIIQKP